MGRVSFQSFFSRDKISVKITLYGRSRTVGKRKVLCALPRFWKIWSVMVKNLWKILNPLAAYLSKNLARKQDYLKS